MIWLMPASMQAEEYVILIHGLSRTSKSMVSMERALHKAGYKTYNLNYPSRSKIIPDLVKDYLKPAVTFCKKKKAKKIHFITHSMGGIMVRDFFSRNKLPNLGRVVMLAPPNQGSEVVDKLKGWRAFTLITGKAGRQLGTTPKSYPKILPHAHFPLGIIAGNRSINWINSMIIKGPDDGKVSVKNTKLKGMADHIVLPHSHPFIMKSRSTIKHTIHFLKHGKF